MADTPGTTEALRERLTHLLADWGAEMSAVLSQLDDERGRVDALESAASAKAEHDGERERQIAELDERVRHQETLIETLRADAEAANGLRRELNERDDELTKIRSDLDMKHELVQALRRDAEQVDRLRSEAKRTGRELEDLRTRNAQLESEVKRLESAVKSLEHSVHEGSAEDSAEIESLRAELDARKSLIRSLRADADRARTLERRLDEERQVIQQLEDTINRHADTITELKRNADLWKRRYRDLKGDPQGDQKGDAGGATTTSLPAFAETDLAAVAEQLQHVANPPDRTVAIDMRRSLIEARRAAQARE